MDTLNKDCRVRIPAAAQEYKCAEDVRRKATDTLRLVPITLIVEAIIEAGLRAGGWHEIVQRLSAERYTLLTRRGRQPKKKPS